MDSPFPEEAISIPLSQEQIAIDGILTIPKEATAIVVFAHGSGSSRFSPRNRFVGEFFLKENIATLQVDLLTPKEEAIDEETRELRFNIPLLARRLGEVADWLKENPKTSALKIGYFGSSTGASAALIAAVEGNTKIDAIVSRGGRVDLAARILPKVKSPSLFIVGGYDFDVLELNHQAYEMLACEKKMEIVPNATHLFEEPKALDTVARLATTWFKQHLK